MKLTKRIACCAVTAVALHAQLTNAITLDLTTIAINTGTINGAIFNNTEVGSTGTGVISPFVRIQDDGIADGYNASVRPVMPDVNTSPTFTHDLLLSAVPVVNRSGTLYYEFLLDINQQGNNPLLSLDKIQIYTRSTALTTANTLAALTAAPSVLRYDLDAGTDNEILLNYGFNNGSGSGDLFAYIPKSLFGATSDFVYFYSMFGAKGGAYAENDGFEEWATRQPGPVTSVPDSGATVMLLGAAFAALGAGRRFLKV